MSIFELILLVIAGLLLIIAAIFAVLAASDVAKIEGFQQDPKLKTAHRWLTWASVVGWVGVAVILVLIIIYIYQSSKSMTQGQNLSSNWVLRLFLFLTLAILITAGVFAAIGAVDIQNSPKVSQAKQTGAQRNAIIATILALAGGGLIIIGFIVSLFNRGKAKEEGKKEETKEGEIAESEGSKEAGLAELLEKDPEILLA